MYYNNIQEIVDDLHLDANQVITDLKNIGIFMFNPRTPFKTVQKEVIKRAINQGDFPSWPRSRNMSVSVSRKSVSVSRKVVIPSIPDNFPFSDPDNEAERNAAEKLMNYVARNRVFFDSSALLQPSAQIMLERMRVCLSLTGGKMYVPRAVWGELEKKKAEQDNPALSCLADMVLRKLMELGAANLLVCPDGEGDSDLADAVFLSQFSALRMHVDLMLVTNDKNLGREILQLNDSQAVRSRYHVTVQKVTSFGYFGVLEGFTPHSNTIFPISTEITDIPQTPIKLTHPFSEGDCVYTDSGNVFILSKKIGSGGEGTIYLAGTNKAAKIYHSDALNERRIAKLRAMLSTKLSFEGLCWPESMLYNDKQEPIGYLMQLVKPSHGRKITELYDLLSPANIINEKPGWKKHQLVTLAQSILRTIVYLHRCGIILGDINSSNILIEDEYTVYFIDTDSYQIRDFPCPVGTPEHTPKEFQNRDLSETLRTMANENFTVASVLFSILMLGKRPYDQIDGGSVTENIRTEDFSYPLGENSNKKAPIGPWRYLWSHFPYFLKTAFYNTFRANECFNTPENRLSAEKWLKIVTSYLEKLDGMIQNDPESGEMIPTRYKITHCACKKCGRSVEKNEMLGGYCRECLNEGEHYHCAVCGAEVVYTLYQKEIKKYPRSPYCKSCLDKRNEVVAAKTCKECGESFEIKRGEMEFYTSKNMRLPERCPVCRKFNKTRQQTL